MTYMSRISGILLFVVCLTNLNDSIVDLSFLLYTGSIIHLINYSTNPGTSYFQMTKINSVHCLSRRGVRFREHPLYAVEKSVWKISFYTANLKQTFKHSLEYRSLNNQHLSSTPSVIITKFISVHHPNDLIDSKSERSQ